MIQADLHPHERPAEEARRCIEAVLAGSLTMTPTARHLLEHALVQVKESEVREALARMFAPRPPDEAHR